MVRTSTDSNPSRAHFELARQRGWPIVVERKDVTCDLQTRLEDSVLEDGTA